MLRGDLYDLVSLSRREDGCSAELSLNEGSCIYAAHFPGMPITPGVCIVQMCVEVLSEALGRTLAMTGAKDVRFLVPLTPDAVRRIVIDFSPLAAGPVDFVVKAGDTVHAKLKLILE